MKTARITLKYCRGLLERHYSEIPVPDPEESASDEMTPEALRGILLEAKAGDRFKVCYDPEDQDHEDSWDLIGPGMPFGNIWFHERCEAERARDAVNNILREHFGPSPRKALLTPEAHLNRVILDGPCCPACGSCEIGIGEKRIKGASHVVFRSCGVCNAEWQEVYSLQGYRDLLIS